MKAAILGTTGYTGQVLLRLLADHPEITEIYPASSSSSGVNLLEVDPGLGDAALSKTNHLNSRLISIEEAVAAKPDVVFAALPHLKSAGICEPFFGKSVVIDLSADFRIKDHKRFHLAYGQAPPRPDLLDKAVYGLSEWYAADIASADLIANPGCYPTTTLLPLIPLLRAGLVAGDIIVNAISGISGAGRKAADAYLFCTRSENANAYSPGRIHRHTHEIQQEVDVAQAGGIGAGGAAAGGRGAVAAGGAAAGGPGAAGVPGGADAAGSAAAGGRCAVAAGGAVAGGPGAAGVPGGADATGSAAAGGRGAAGVGGAAAAGSAAQSTVYFTPHLAPIKQGMEVTTTFKLAGGADPATIDGILADSYKGKPFVRYTGSRIPQSAQVRGTNRVDFSLHVDGDRVFLLSVSDNLYKGASGQAVQNMNIRFGFPESAGIPQHGEI